jgi:hypothetical protein
MTPTLFTLTRHEMLSHLQAKKETSIDIPPKLCFNLISEKDLKKRLLSLGLPTDGKKQVWVPHFIPHLIPHLIPLGPPAPDTWLDFCRIGWTDTKHTAGSYSPKWMREHVVH